MTFEIPCDCAGISDAGSSPASSNSLEQEPRADDGRQQADSSCSWLLLAAGLVSASEIVVGSE